MALLRDLVRREAVRVLARVKFRCGRCGHALYKAEDGTFHSRHTVNDADTGAYLSVEERDECEDGFSHGPVSPVDER